MKWKWLKLTAVIGGVLGVAGLMGGLPVSPELFAISLGMLPLVGTAFSGNGSATIDAEAINLNEALGGFGGGNGELPPSFGAASDEPDWLLGVKGAFDGFLKIALFFFHWILLSGALPFQKAYFGDAPGVGAFMDAVGLGDFTLAALMSWILAVVAILIPVVLWYLMFTTNVLGNFKGFWQSSAVNRVLFVTVMAVYVGILSMEWTILFGRIEQMTAASKSPLPSFIERPNPLVMVVLSFLVSLITFILGALTAKLVMTFERRFAQ